MADAEVSLFVSVSQFFSCRGTDIPPLVWLCFDWSYHEAHKTLDCWICIDCSRILLACCSCSNTTWWSTPCLRKKLQISFCQNFIKFPPILIIFGKKMAKRLKLCQVYSFFISINLHHHTTVLNVDVLNCYIMLKVVSIRLLTHCIINSIQGATWLSNFVGLNIW